MRKYYSNYTGPEIDEAVKAIIENEISLEDLSEELIETIKSWSNKKELQFFGALDDFPRKGDPECLYVATKESKIYFWATDEGDYKTFSMGTPEVSDTVINSIKKNEEDIKALDSRIDEIDVLIKKNEEDIKILDSRISGIDVLVSQSANKITEIETQINTKASKTDLDNLAELIGVRKENEKRSVFDILTAHDGEIKSNTFLIEGLNKKIPTIETSIQQITSNFGSELAALAAQTLKVKYEVLPVEGLIVDYRDTEIRLNTERVVPVHQSVGAGGNPNMFYVTFRAYAPVGAAKVIEGNNDVMDTEASELSVDAYGRKYTTIWAAVANYSGGTWTKWGDNSTLNKYFGFLYSFHWFDASGNIIQMDKVRVILTNDKCHTDLVPDVVARRIDEKVKEISTIDLSNYYTKEQVDNLIPTSESIQSIIQSSMSSDIVKEILIEQNFVTTDTVDNIVGIKVNSVIDEKLVDYVSFKDEEEIVLNGGSA